MEVSTTFWRTRRGGLPDARAHPALALLVQGYLTLDWSNDYSDAWAAVDDDIAREPIVKQLPDEVARLVEPRPSEESLRALILDELGCGYLPDADGFTMTTWLLDVRERVRGALAD